LNVKLKSLKNPADTLANVGAFLEYHFAVLTLHFISVSSMKIKFISNYLGSKLFELLSPTDW
jgi:hypothetical protein